MFVGFWSQCELLAGLGVCVLDAHVFGAWGGSDAFGWLHIWRDSSWREPWHSPPADPCLGGVSPQLQGSFASGCWLRFLNNTPQLYYDHGLCEVACTQSTSLSYHIGNGLFGSLMESRELFQPPSDIVLTRTCGQWEARYLSSDCEDLGRLHVGRWNPNRVWEMLGETEVRKRLSSQGFWVLLSTLSVTESLGLSKSCD